VRRFHPRRAHLRPEALGRQVGDSTDELRVEPGCLQGLRPARKRQAASGKHDTSTNRLNSVI